VGAAPADAAGYFLLRLSFRKSPGVNSDAPLAPQLPNQPKDCRAPTPETQQAPRPCGGVMRSACATGDDPPWLAALSHPRREIRPWWSFPGQHLNARAATQFHQQMLIDAAASHGCDPTDAQRADARHETDQRAPAPERDLDAVAGSLQSTGEGLEPDVTARPARVLQDRALEAHAPVATEDLVGTLARQARSLVSGNSLLVDSIGSILGPAGKRLARHLLSLRALQACRQALRVDGVDKPSQSRHL